MGFEKVYLLGKIELHLEATAAGVLTFASDVPGGTLAERGALNIPAGPRHVFARRLPYYLQGHLFKFGYTPGDGQSRLYGARVWARENPGGEWQWYALPVVPTPAGDWSTVKLEIPPTGDWTSAELEVPAAGAWTSGGLSIPQTPDNWNTVELEVPATGNWTDMQLPIKPTPLVPDWVSLEIDG